MRNTQPVTASVHVEIRAPTGGFLSVTDWPLLPFYGVSFCMGRFLPFYGESFYLPIVVVFAFLWGKFCAFDFDLMVHYGWSSPQTMCGVYVLLGLLWLIVCALHWRDILRIQFWIGT